MKLEGSCGLRFWLMRVAEEHQAEASKRAERIGDLFFQAVNFPKMREEIQKEVVEELVKDMKEFGWEDTVKEYFGDYLQTAQTKTKEEKK